MDDQVEPVERPEGLREALDGIVSTIAARVDERPADLRDPAGCALLLALVARQFGDQEQAAETAIDLTTGLFDGRHLTAGLFGGMWGCGLTLSTLRRWGWSVSFDFETLDLAATDCLENVPWGGHFDLVRGLVAVGMYGLERAAATGRTEIVDATVRALLSCAARRGDGLTWFSRPELAVSLRDRFPNGLYDLGMAHGVAGVISFLARALPVVATPGQVSQHLQDAMAWLTSQALPSERGLTFPAFVDPEQGEPSPARLAWCYGDLGVSIAMADAGYVLAESAWEEEAARLAHACAARGFSESGIVDTTLCHGSQGAAHLFWRWYQRTGDSRFEQAALRWTGVTLAKAAAQRRLDAVDEIPGVTFRIQSDESWEWRSDDTLLEGASGVGLSLATLVGRQVPAWDAQFGTDPIGRGRG